MTLPLLYIRTKQLQKEVNGLGLYLILLIPLAAFLIFASFKIFQKGESAYYLVSLLLAICISIQYYRKDKSFVYKHIKSPHLQLFSEYAALTFPFSITCIITKYWFCFPLLLFMLFFVPFFQFRISQKVVLKKLSAIIPASDFEWLSGVRKNYIAVIGLYSLALAFSWFRILPLFLLWFLTVVISSFYTEYESLQILREQAKSPRNYLLFKLKKSTIYILLLYLPVIIINSIFNSEYLLINLLFIPVQIAILHYAITLKYTSYKPNKSQPGNNIPLAIVSISSALPYFLPIPAILSFVYFYKAAKNLKNYLND